MDFQNEWISVKQALQTLNISSRTTLYKYANKYNLRMSKLGGKVYFNISDIMALFLNNAVVMGI